MEQNKLCTESANLKGEDESENTSQLSEHRGYKVKNGDVRNDSQHDIAQINGIGLEKIDVKNDVDNENDDQLLSCVNEIN